MRKTGWSLRSLPPWHGDVDGDEESVKAKRPRTDAVPGASTARPLTILQMAAGPPSDAAQLPLPLAPPTFSELTIRMKGAHADFAAWIKLRDDGQIRVAGITLSETGENQSKFLKLGADPDEFAEELAAWLQKPQQPIREMLPLLEGKDAASFWAWLHERFEPQLSECVSSLD